MLPFPPSLATLHARLTARSRPAVAAAILGGVAGLAIGGAYLAGEAAQAASFRAKAERIEGATAAGFTEEALSAAAGGLDASALKIARRHDPYTVAGGAQRDRQAELLSARLERLRLSDNGLRRVAFDVGPAARPFHLANALDASRDLECLTQAVYYEARGEGRSGMEAVAQVVLNRVRHPAFPKSVCGVVFQGAARRTGCQFSFTCNGAMRGRVNPAAWNRARSIASAALSGSVSVAVGSATHFHTTGVAPGWRNSLIRVGQVGSHVFYRFGGRAGSVSTFTYEARPSTEADQPRLIQASLDPVEPVRQAGQAVAYTLVLAQEASRRAPERDEQAEAALVSVKTPTVSTAATTAAGAQGAPTAPPVA